ncbi:MaoC family dehydratase [Martelella soudanensis]|uniref:MaoC family dehydratase n=1 Tax=unclassified Martelella TaxID=2629616 RepID=UPI0015E025FF|nr:MULTISPECIES: MaoC family dehydratase [unclassified Martelella]
MIKPPITLSHLTSLVSEEIGLSDWHTMDQQRISDFADTTEDHQFIHIDPARADATPLGGTIAHGFLTMSMLSVMLNEAVGEIGGSSMSLNYGFNSIRFLSPVPAGARIRGRFWVASCKQRTSDQWKLTLQVSVEIENHEKPALVAEWMILLARA